MKPFKRLRTVMFEKEVRVQDLAPAIGVRSGVNVSDRLMGRTVWRLDEIYAVMEFLELPLEDMHIYFPKDGKDDMSCVR